MSADLLTSTYLRLRCRLKAFARRMLNDDSETDDVLQEAFYHLWQKRENIVSAAQAEGMTIVTLRNKCIDVIRQRRFHEDLPTEQSEAAVSDEDDYNSREELYRKVMAIIDNRLSERERKVITMRDTLELTFADIAEELELSEANVRLILSRARKKVRDIYLSSKNSNI